MRGRAEGLAPTRTCHVEPAQEDEEIARHQPGCRGGRNFLGIVLLCFRVRRSYIWVVFIFHFRVILFSSTSLLGFQDEILSPRYLEDRPIDFFCIVFSLYILHHTQLLVLYLILAFIHSLSLLKNASSKAERRFQ